MNQKIKKKNRRFYLDKKFTVFQQIVQIIIGLVSFGMLRRTKFAFKHLIPFHVNRYYIVLFCSKQLRQTNICQHSGRVWHIFEIH